MIKDGATHNKGPADDLVLPYRVHDGKHRHGVRVEHHELDMVAFDGVTVAQEGSASRACVADVVGRVFKLRHLKNNGKPATGHTDKRHIKAGVVPFASSAKECTFRIVNHVTDRTHRILGNAYRILCHPTDGTPNGCGGTPNRFGGTPNPTDEGAK
jgi:hypothetical protein